MCCREKPGLPPIESCTAITALQKYYDVKVYPTEKRHLYSQFYTPGFTQAELEGKPVVMLLGQYSVGKTSLVEYLCNGKYPGADIGPEPTTDIFAHIQYSDEPMTIDGPALAQDKSYSLKGLEIFGEKFLNKLRATNFKAEILQHISILDTPGILAGKKQTDARGYDFAAIINFLAERVDKIILMFDANKVDLSDEYRDVIKALDKHCEKVRILLNKCDSIRPRELIQVRGALMWALGKIFTTPEVPKVYIGSFWKYLPEKSIVSKTMMEDTKALLKEITDLPNTCKSRRINDMVKRAKQVKIHAAIMDSLIRSQFIFDLPTALKAKNISKTFVKVAKKYNFVLTDLPDEKDFQTKASKTDGKLWLKINLKEFSMLCRFLEEDITKIIAVANAEPKPEIKFKVMEKISKPPELKGEFTPVKNGQSTIKTQNTQTPNATTPKESSKKTTPKESSSKEKKSTGEKEVNKFVPESTKKDGEKTEKKEEEKEKKDEKKYEKEKTEKKKEEKEKKNEKEKTESKKKNATGSKKS